MFSEFKCHLKEYKKNEKPASTFYHRHFSKNGAKLATFLFLKVGLGPNWISLLSFVLVIACCYLISISSSLVLTLILLQVAYIFDCSDGVVARITGRGSPFGELLDVSLDRILGCLFSFALFIHLSREYETDIPIFVYAILLSSYLSYTFLSTLRSYVFSNLKNMAKNERKSAINKLVFLIYEFIDTGIYYLVMSVALLIHFLDFAIIFYGVVSLPLIFGTYFVCWRSVNEN